MSTSNHILETVLGSRGEGLYQRVVCVGHDGECGVQQSWADDPQASAEATLNTNEIVLHQGPIRVSGVDEYGIESWEYDDPHYSHEPDNQGRQTVLEYALDHLRQFEDRMERIYITDLRNNH